VILKPNPPNLQELYLNSLARIGIDPLLHDIRFVEDDWENPTVGAWGLGWEVWCDGMEVSQYTYFQQVGGLDVRPVSGELTYGLERLAMYVFGVDRVYDLPFNDPDSEYPVTYGDIFLENEKQQSRFNFELSDSDMVLRWFSDAEAQAKRLIEAKCVLPAFDYTLKASHLFNLLDARGVVSPTERQSFIARVRDLAKGCAQQWAESQEVTT
jgi:glycyl-tRNA synthetase alpha chain